MRAQPSIDSLNGICDTIRKHVHEVTKHEIVRMVLFVKVDANDQMWFMYTTSIRLETKSNHVPKPLDIEGICPAPREIVSPPRAQDAEGGKGEFSRCPGCSNLILGAEKQMITCRQAVEVFTMLTKSKAFKETGQLPKDQFGCAMSANMFDMKRAIALQTGAAFDEPKPRLKKGSKHLWGKVKSDIVKDEYDLGNKFLIPPVIRNAFDKVKPQRMIELLRDEDFLATEIQVCLECWLRHHEKDLPQQLDLIRHNGAPATCAIRSKHNHKRRNRTRRSHSCPIPAGPSADLNPIPEEDSQYEANTGISQSRRGFNKSLWTPAFTKKSGNKGMRDKDHGVVLPALPPARAVAIEWD